jgi:AcrR family transcriptional regulator
VRLALEHGTAALTVDQICAAVGITQRSFFNHFDTKEDALLGWDLPRLSEQRTAEYLADPAVGILSGAMSLVDLPMSFLDDPELMRDRFVVLSGSPALAQRQSVRMLGVARAVAEVVLLKLQTIAAPDADPQQLQATAESITAMAAGLNLRASGPLDGPPTFPPPGGGTALDELRWVWDRLI